VTYGEEANRGIYREAFQQSQGAYRVGIHTINPNLYEVLMNSKSFILFIIVLCFVVGFASPCTGEDTKTALIVKNIAFNRSQGGIEKIALFCNQSCIPELFSLEGRNPRLVMDMKGVFLIQTKARNISTGGKLVKRVRSYLDKQTTILRIVLDMQPSKYYIVRPMPDPSGNYMLAITEDTDSQQSQEKHITILRPDLKTEEKAGKLQEGLPNEEKHRTVKELQSMAQERLQLNAGEFSAAVDKFHLMSVKVIGNRDSKRYHLPGMKYYDLVKTYHRVVFQSEKEAIQAGYHKAPR
jgi:hypothetical protein